MDSLWKCTDYLMDFNKVRKFQELCGLQAADNFDSCAGSRAACEKSTVFYGSSSACERKCEQELYDEVDGLTSDVNLRRRSNDSVYCTENSYEEADGLTTKHPQENVQDESVQQDTESYKVGNWFFYYLFRLGSTFGHEIFYITFIPYVIWNIDPFIARKMVVVWVVTMYIGQALKDLIQWPRPSWPPVFKLEKRVQAEYGIPSTHAIAGTALPFSFLMAMNGRYDFCFGLGVVLACTWCLLVGLSRLYVGMHSILDVICGVLFTAIYLWLGWSFMESVDEYAMTSQFAPWIIVLSHFLLGVFFPSTDHYSTTRGDTVIILAAGAGIHCASYVLHHYGFDFDPSGEQPFPVTWPTISSFSISMARFAIGGVLLFLTRAVMKSLSLSLICHVYGISKHDRIARQRKDVEVPYKFATYLAVGFAARAVVPVTLLYMGVVH